MITLKVHNTYVTWPEDIADMMISFYRKHDVEFEILHNFDGQALTWEN